MQCSGAPPHSPSAMETLSILAPPPLDVTQSVYCPTINGAGETPTMIGSENTHPMDQSPLDGPYQSINVSIIGCAGLQHFNNLCKTPCNPYCVLQYGDVIKMTKVKANLNDPYFGEEFSFPLSRSTEKMFLTIKHRDDTGNQPLGWVSVPTSSVEDYVRQSRLEKALNGLSFSLPSSPGINDPSQWEAISKAKSDTLNIARCSDVSEKELRDRYPGMKRIPLQSTVESKAFDTIALSEAPHVFLRFEIKPLDTSPIGENPVCSASAIEEANNDKIFETSRAESPVLLTLSFAEDIVPFALDSALLSEWTFSVHRDLSIATGEHQSRFDLMSADIKDVVNINLRVVPVSMSPDGQSSRTAKEVANDISMQVYSIKSALRRAIPSLFRVVHVGDGEESNSENEYASSTTASDDMGSSVQTLDDVQEPEVLIGYADMSQSSDDELKLENSGLHAFRSAAPQASPKPTMNPKDVGEEIAQLSKVSSGVQHTNADQEVPWKGAIEDAYIPALKNFAPKVKPLQGGELFQQARQSLM